MTSYVDSSALLKRYVDEPDSDAADLLLDSDEVLITCWITVVEVRRSLARLLSGTDLAVARRQFADDIESFAMMDVVGHDPYARSGHASA